MLQEKENKKAKTKDLDSSVDLLKIQVVSERIHVRLTQTVTTSWAIWISFSVLFYTLFYQNVLPLVAILTGMITLSLGTIYVIYYFRKSYKKALTKISEMIEKIKQGKELPRLDELIK